jgi:hypothetical protein
MDFKEFYKLLDEVITKESSGIIPTKENFDSFLFNRYLSFYHPEIAVFLSKTANRVNWVVDSDEPQSAFNCLLGIFPKLPKRFIDYVKKTITDELKELKVKDEDIWIEARMNECSKREILDLIDYAKRSRKRKVV